MTAGPRATVSRCTSAAHHGPYISTRTRCQRRPRGPINTVLAPRSGSSSRNQPMPSANPITKIAPTRGLFVVSWLASSTESVPEPRSSVPRPRRRAPTAASRSQRALGKHGIIARASRGNEASRRSPQASISARSGLGAAANSLSSTDLLLPTPFRRAFGGSCRAISASTPRPAVVGAGRRVARNFRGKKARNRRQISGRGRTILSSQK